MTDTPSLRDRLIAALDEDALRPRGQQQGLVNAMLAVVQPDLDRRDAEIDRLRAGLAQVEALLPRDRTEDINAGWIPPRHIRAALDTTN